MRQVVVLPYHFHRIQQNNHYKCISTLEPHTGNEYKYKNAKSPRMKGWTDRRTYYTATQGIWTHWLQTHALFVITGHPNYIQKEMKKTRHREKETNIYALLDPTGILWTQVRGWSTTVEIILRNLWPTDMWSAQNYGLRFYYHQNRFGRPDI